MIRLLTLSRLSLLREERSHSPALVPAVASLSKIGTTFDCHLLQCSSGNRPLDALGTRDQQRRLRAAVAERGANVMVVTPEESVLLEFPDWIGISTRTGAVPDVVAELFSQRVINSEAGALEWLHLEVPAGEDWLRWIVAAFEVVAAAASECPEDMLIVTATGGEAADHGRFESLLWEGVLRVPLWIGEGVNECRRVNRPTGSFDVLETVLSSLNAAAESASIARSLDLRLISGGSSDVTPRSICIRFDGCEAIRTPDFFFVRSRSEGSGKTTALYSKPNDLWNVHDLSHEFPDVADELLARLLENSH